MKDSILKFIEELQIEKNYSELTTKGYLKDLDMFLEYLNDNNIKSYKQIDYNYIRLYINYLYDQKYNNKTISRHISSLKSFFKYLKKEKLINTNPMTLVSNPKLDRRLPKYLNFKDTEKLLSAYSLDNYIDIRNSLILELLYSTGIRVGELVNIKLSDISFVDRTIRILGKGNKERIVFFGSRCYELIKIYLKESYNKLNVNNLDFILVSKTGKQINDRAIRKVIDIASLKIGLTMKISPHVLRHTYATHMLMDGADLRSVQELLGHENLSTTQIYTHLTNEKIRNVYLNAHPRARR